MKTLSKITAVAAIMLLPVSVLAADTAAKADADKPAVSGSLHGFDKYWSKMDPAGKGFVTKEEWMAHAADRFKEIDTNGDGKISKEEMKAHDDKIRQRFMEMRQHRRQIMNDQGGSR
ncbi:MAG: hypothetical protein KGI29_09275 [Pseudomonadota bacterium]|nr:hypothetical protein [Pseudomonadota bacterium]MDE3038201.1 hypothetical protein [Pseudomonadota bacterium]